MPIAYRCDRCHEFRDGLPILDVQLRGEGGRFKTWGICGECVAQLGPWFHALDAIGAGGPEDEFPGG